MWRIVAGACLVEVPGPEVPGVPDHPEDVKKLWGIIGTPSEPPSALLQKKSGTDSRPPCGQMSVVRRVVLCRTGSVLGRRAVSKDRALACAVFMSGAQVSALPQ